MENLNDSRRKNYTVIPTLNLRGLCIEKQWFTCGTNEQYEKLFYANSHGCPMGEIATIIWLCSDEEKHCRRDILTELQKARNRWLKAIEEDFNEEW